MHFRGQCSSRRWAPFSGFGIQWAANGVSHRRKLGERSGAKNGRFLGAVRSKEENEDRKAIGGAFSTSPKKRRRAGKVSFSVLRPPRRFLALETLKSAKINSFWASTRTSCALGGPPPSSFHPNSRKKNGEGGRSVALRRQVPGANRL